jgi:hypothetical protein
MDLIRLQVPLVVLAMLSPMIKRTLVDPVRKTMKPSPHCAVSLGQVLLKSLEQTLM